MMVKSTSGIFDHILIQQAVDRVVSRIDDLARFSEISSGLKRTFCSPAMKDAHHELTGWMQSAGLHVDLDAAGNLIGSTARATGRPVLILGSHLDTVVNAGKFDGPLGVLLGVAVTEVLGNENVVFDFPFDIHVVGFSEEEGVRFNLPFIGSMAMAGNFDDRHFAKTDDQKINLAAALLEFGCNGDIQTASYADKDIVAFLEAHIEQSTVLEDGNVPVGVVSAIAGQTRATITIGGRAGHAGTVPHERRQDALAAAAEIILAVEQLGRDTAGLFATVGRINCRPGVSNAICGNAEIRMDLRHEHDPVRESALAQLRRRVAEVADARHVNVEWVDVQHTPTVPMDRVLNSALESAIVSTGHEPVAVVSGAGHDAMIMAQIAPSSMLFVRCRNGVSHHPDEYVSREDIEIALQVMVDAVIDIARRSSVTDDK